MLLLVTHYCNLHLGIIEEPLFLARSTNLKFFQWAPKRIGAHTPTQSSGLVGLSMHSREHRSMQGVRSCSSHRWPATARTTTFLRLCGVLLLHASCGDARVVTISNVQPRVDIRTGKILELGDGSIAKFGERYYLYGVKYVCTPSPRSPLGYGCPRKDRRIWANMSLGVASSLDMVTWRVETYNLVPEMHDPQTRWPATKYAWFMPTITRNTTHYALWYYIDDFARGVAVSSSPIGPFKIVHDSVPNLQLGSDFFFWQGRDGRTYMKHNGGCGQGPNGTNIQPPKRGSGICVARLSPNMTDIEASSSLINATGEGGGIFERNNRWYIMQGHGCCFCWAGDDAQLWESTNGPFGPYTMQNDIINCSNKNHRGYPGQGVVSNFSCGGPGPGGPCYNAVGSQCVPGSALRGPGAQQFGVFRIPEVENKTAFLYVGIRFGSAPDGNKCHEFQYWDALEFDADGHVLPLKFRDTVTLHLE